MLPTRNLLSGEETDVGSDAKTGKRDGARDGLGEEGGLLGGGSLGEHWGRVFSVGRPRHSLAMRMNLE